MNPVQIAWLAGIVEGEGYISSDRGSPFIRVAMTDEDVVRRVAALFGATVSRPYRPRGNQTKDVWTVTVHGYRAIGWLMTLYLFLGVRRRSAAGRAIAMWNAAPGHARKVRGPDGRVLPAICHPDRPLHARQKCKQCYERDYMKEWRRRTGRSGTYYRNRTRAA